MMAGGGSWAAARTVRRRCRRGCSWCSPHLGWLAGTATRTSTTGRLRAPCGCWCSRLGRGLGGCWSGAGVPGPHHDRLRTAAPHTRPVATRWSTDQTDNARRRQRKSPAVTTLAVACIASGPYATATLVSQSVSHQEREGGGGGRLVGHSSEERVGAILDRSSVVRFRPHMPAGGRCHRTTAAGAEAEEERRGRQAGRPGPTASQRVRKPDSGSTISHQQEANRRQLRPPLARVGSGGRHARSTGLLLLLLLRHHDRLALTRGERSDLNGPSKAGAAG